MAHRHRSIRETGPYGCKGSVYFVKHCACGAKRRTCSCHQCRIQREDDSGWYLPECPGGQTQPSSEARR